METIIAPVDFSDVSDNALLFAAELSKRAAARLIIVNVFEKGEDEEDSRDQLKSVVAKLKRKFGSDLTFEPLVAHGDLIPELKKIIAIRKPDLIVMGTHGASGLKKILFGSNAVNVIEKIKLPVFVIPDMARFENFKARGKSRVVLATDLDVVKDETSLDILKKIALLIIEAKLRVVSVRPKNVELDYLKLEREDLLSVFRPEIETERFTVFSESVMDGINFYLNEHTDTGLIAVIARDSGHLIQKNYTRELASHAHLPLLVLHDAKI